MQNYNLRNGNIVCIVSKFIILRIQIITVEQICNEKMQGFVKKSNLRIFIVYPIVLGSDKTCPAFTLRTNRDARIATSCGSTPFDPLYNKVLIY